MNIYHKMMIYLKNPLLLIPNLGKRGLLNFVSDQLYLKLCFRAKLQAKLNIHNPTTFNEKMQWLKLYNRSTLYMKMVDKYEAKMYITEKVGDDYIVPTLGLWEKVDDIDFDALPDKFVLKCTHDSGSVSICSDKKIYNIADAKRKLRKALVHNAYCYGREWPYKNLQPRIIAEQYLEDDTRKDISDYKIFCFDGVPQLILVCTERFSKTGLKEDFFTTSWEHLNVHRPLYPNSSYTIEKPLNLKKMLELSRQLSTNIPFLRTDFYCVNGNVYIGELTLYPASGFRKFIPESYDKLLGSWITLPITIEGK